MLELQDLGKVRKVPRTIESIVSALDYDSADEHLPSDLEIESFESLVNGKLPLDYRLFLKAVGYIQFVDDVQIVIPTARNSLTTRTDPSFRVSNLYGLNGGNPLLDAFQRLKKDDGFPKGVIDIGESQGSSFFCIDLNDSRAGTISLCEDFGNHFYEIAPSFTDFLERLYVDESSSLPIGKSFWEKIWPF